VEYRLRVRRHDADFRVVDEGETANIPMALASFCFAACALFVVGALVAGKAGGAELRVVDMSN
jgi:hypothetical protein